MDFSEHEFLLIWDVENQRSGHERVAAIQKLIRATFPGIRLRYYSYGDTTHLAPEQKETCYRIGAPIRDIPRIPLHENRPNGPFAQGVADRSMMTDLFTFVYETQSPNFVMVVSGDRDFSRPLEAITGTGYTAMLVCNPDRTHEVLKNSVTFVYDWRLIQQDGFTCGPSPPPALRPSLPRLKNLHVPVTIVMWDTDSVPFPYHLPHDRVNEILVHQLISPNVPVLGYVFFRVYGQVLPGRRSDAVVYKQTTRAGRKETHLESNFIADMGEFVCSNRNGVTNVVIISNNSSFGELVLWISNLGFRTLLVGATDMYMRNAAQVNLPTPLWW